MEKPSKQQVLAGLVTGGLLTAVIVGTLVRDHVVSLPFGLLLAAGGMAGAWLGPRIVSS